MNTSCGDTVKCRLDAGKSPIFRSQSPCTYIYVQESQQFWDFIRNITYCKGLKEETWRVTTSLVLTGDNEGVCHAVVKVKGVIPYRREPYRRVPLGRVRLDARRLDEVQ